MPLVYAIVGTNTHLPVSGFPFPSTEIVSSTRIASIIAPHAHRRTRRRSGRNRPNQQCSPSTATFLERCFTHHEQFTAEPDNRRRFSTKPRFAAKEAAMKALGTGWLTASPGPTSVFRTPPAPDSRHRPPTIACARHPPLALHSHRQRRHGLLSPRRLTG